ncbi:MAG: ABC transporter ATP-binding protein [Janthinobacterium lividum]
MRPPFSIKSSTACQARVPGLADAVAPLVEAVPARQSGGLRMVVENISHAFGALPVLEGIGFSVGMGETVAIVGPSGCGKSTLLGVLGGLVKPQVGRVVLQGELPAASLNPITYVFQDFALLPWRTVAQNIALVLKHHGLSAAQQRERIDACLALTGLTEFANAFPVQLSGGMKQRAGIARALAVRPAVLLMDEPLSALDAQTRELLMDDFLRLWDEQPTATVYVTHNLDEALALADRVLVLSRRPGRIKEAIEVPIPRRARRSAECAADMARLHERLWNHIREEARSADRELSDGRN